MRIGRRKSAFFLPDGHFFRRAARRAGLVDDIHLLGSAKGVSNADTLLRKNLSILDRSEFLGVGPARQGLTLGESCSYFG